MQGLVAQVMTLYPRIYFACHTRHVRDESTGQVISAHQASILDHLDEIEPTSLAALAAHMGVTLSTMSLTVDRLVRAGYVTRSRDAQDGRRIGLRLTGEGVVLKSQKTVLDPRLVEDLLDQLPPADCERAVEGLALLARAANEMMQKKSTRGKAGNVA
ncbi:MAG TPA: MarR family winged helix-turn-helix transcriptional regulator [Bryobacteraceae bacterium]|nr:MarR family winged helix-turn-helix transcriptional regulator [Bryobacteraceae bacterium]